GCDGSQGCASSERLVDRFHCPCLVGNGLSFEGVAKRAHSLRGASLLCTLPLGATLTFGLDLDLVARDRREEIRAEASSRGGAVDVGPFGEGQQYLVPLRRLDDANPIGAVAF